MRPLRRVGPGGMSEYTVIRRTFEAKKHPKGSPERTRLNMDAVTSEYLPSYRYQVVGRRFGSAFRTKAEAQAFIDRETSSSTR